MTNNALVYPPDPPGFVVESELPLTPETFTDGVETWQDFGQETLPAKSWEDHVSGSISTTIEDLFRKRGFYNVPASVIERLEEEARKIVEAAQMPGRIDAEVNAQPEYDEVLDARLLRDSRDLEPVVRRIHGYILGAEGLGANADGDLCVDLTPEEWSWLVVYSMYYTGGQNTPARFHDASWKMRARHPGFGNRKPVLFTHPANAAQLHGQAQ